MLYLIPVFLIPIFFVFGASFTSWNLLNPAAGINFVGLRNYISLLTDPGILTAMRNTLVFTAVSVPLSMILGFGLALCVNKLKRTLKITETLLLVPLMVVPVSIFLTFRFMFEPTFGVVNSFLSLLGISGPGWFATTNTAMLSIIIVEMWRVVPFVYIVTFAALKMIPSEPLEAAQVDGANALQTLFFVTIPMIKPALLVMLIVRLMDAIRVFDLIFVLTRGGPANATRTIQYAGFELSFQGFLIGRGSALAVIIVLIIIILGFGIIKAMHKANEEML